MQRVIRQVHDIIHYAGEITFVQRITLRTVALKTRYAQVLKGITLDLIMNMKTTLLGASRSGKTTLFLDASSMSYRSHGIAILQPCVHTERIR